MGHKNLILFLLARLGHGNEAGHWCKGETQRNYEVIVSPRLVDSVPCLELYRSGKIDETFHGSPSQYIHRTKHKWATYYLI